MHSISGIFYPSVWRANGAGWATSIAKIGSIAGPLIGGYILATNFPVRHIFALLAVSPAVLAISLLLLEWQRRRGGRRMPDAVLAE
jgi:AAHS family 4-hydroxybenzoate transporter-like MFS transporter